MGSGAGATGSETMGSSVTGSEAMGSGAMDSETMGSGALGSSVLDPGTGRSNQRRRQLRIWRGTCEALKT